MNSSNLHIVGMFSYSADCILAILNSLKCGGALLNSNGGVISLNVTASSYLGQGLVRRGEQLKAVDRTTDERLQSMIACAVTGNKAQSLSIAIPRPDRRPLIVRLVRLDEPRRSTSSATVLLVMVDAELRRGPSPEILAQAFDLTKVELEVAIGIVCGKTLGEMAAARGIKIGTVRAHSKAVFWKTHTRGQADLTAVLSRFAFVVPHTENL